MAKRKRLSPAAVTGAPEAPLETKAMNGWVGTRARAPIADVAGDSATQSAFEEVAEELRAARNEGRMVLSLPLSAIDPTHLVRDRVGLDVDEMEVLKTSLRDRGQQAPAEVVDLGAGRYGLISGWRRYRALQEIAQEDAQGDPHIQVLVRTPEGAGGAYKAMVEENEIRADLSFYERARIALKAVEQGIYSDPKEAVQSLFSAARPAKRSKILKFMPLVENLDDHLRFPGAIPEKLGLPLSAELEEDPARGQWLRAKLKTEQPADAAAERAVLEQVLARPTGAGVDRPGRQRIEVCPGVTLEFGKARAVVSGPAVDGTLLEELRLFLEARGRQ